MNDTTKPVITELRATLWELPDGTLQGYTKDRPKGPWVTLDEAQAFAASRTDTLRARIAELEAAAVPVQAIPVLDATTTNTLATSEINRLVKENFGRFPQGDWADKVLSARDLCEKLLRLSAAPTPSKVTGDCAVCTLGIPGACYCGPAAPSPQAEPPQQLMATLHAYEEIAEHYAKCAISPEALRDWVAARMDKNAEPPNGWVLVPYEPATPTPDYVECARQATVATGLPSLYPGAWMSIFIREINRWCQHATQPTQDADSLTVPITATDEITCAIEAMVDQQLRASAIEPIQMFRQDGSRIWDAAIAAIQAKGGQA